MRCQEEMEPGRLAGVRVPVWAEDRAALVAAKAPVEVRDKDKDKDKVRALARVRERALAGDRV